MQYMKCNCINTETANYTSEQNCYSSLKCLDSIGLRFNRTLRNCCWFWSFSLFQFYFKRGIFITLFSGDNLCNRLLLSLPFVCVCVVYRNNYQHSEKCEKKWSKNCSFHHKRSVCTYAPYAHKERFKIHCDLLLVLSRIYWQKLLHSTIYFFWDWLNATRSNVYVKTNRKYRCTRRCICNTCHCTCTNGFN